VRVFDTLPTADQEELFGHVQVFLAEKRFEGCAGLTMTDEIRVTIAAQACLLLLHRETDYYPSVVSILVYPHTILATEPRQIGYVVSEEPTAVLGQTGRRLGVVLLAWDATQHGVIDPHDGDNVVVHEFAHQLDYEDGVTDGTPALPSRAAVRTWARVLGADYKRLQADARAGRSSVLDDYGATNPAEFFAVATETFFERPRALRRHRPDLYAQLEAYFHQDPAALAPPEHFPPHPHP
jgi:MtfA peptidase